MAVPGATNAGVRAVADGGLVASLVGCNSIRTAATFGTPPERRPRWGPPDAACVTGRLPVDFREPTPLDRPVRLGSWPDGPVGREATVRTEVGPPGA